MRNIFKVMSCVGLMCFASVNYVLGMTPAQIERGKRESKISNEFRSCSDSEKADYFQKLLQEKSLYLLDPALLMNFLVSLPAQDRAKRVLELYQQAFDQMPVVVAVACIPLLASPHDRGTYCARLLRREDQLDTSWWGTLRQDKDTGKYEYFRGFKGYSKWLGPELLKLFPKADKIAWAKFFLKKYWNDFSLSDIVRLIELLPEESERVSYVNQILETRSALLFVGFHSQVPGEDALWKLISPQKRNELIVAFLAREFDDLNFGCVCKLVGRIDDRTAKMGYGRRLLLSVKMLPISTDEERRFIECSLAVNDVLGAMFDGRLWDTCLFYFLEQHFGTMDCDVLLALVAQIPYHLAAQKLIYLRRLLAEKRLIKLDEKKVDALFQDVPSKESAVAAKMLLEEFFESSTAFIIAKLTNKLSIEEGLKAKVKAALVEQPREKWFRRLIESKKLETEPTPQLSELLTKHLSSQERETVLAVLKRCLDTLSKDKVSLVIDFLPQEEKDALMRKHNIFWNACCCDDSTAAGPLFSTRFRMAHSRRIIAILQYKSLQQDKMKHVEEMMTDFSHFMEEQYRRGRVVFLHGQHDLWEYLGKLFDALVAIKNGRPVSANYVRFRFQERPILSDDEVRATREHGIPAREAFKDIWFHLLFTNLHLLANEAGSNSLEYMLDNYDQTSKSKRFDIHAGIKAQFAELDMLPEYEELMRERPELFSELYALYKKEVVARGDIGRLVAISMPVELAQRLAYSTTSGGPLKPIRINSEETVDVTKIASNFDKVPFENEYVIIMSEEMTNPARAAAAGVEMRCFSADANEESLPLAYAYEEHFTAAKAWIAYVHHQKKERMSRFREKCPWALNRLYRTKAKQQIQQPFIQLGQQEIASLLGKK